MYSAGWSTRFCFHSPGLLRIRNDKMGPLYIIAFASTARIASHTRTPSSTSTSTTGNVTPSSSPPHTTTHQLVALAALRSNQLAPPQIHPPTHTSYKVELVTRLQLQVTEQHARCPCMMRLRRGLDLRCCRRPVCLFCCCLLPLPSHYYTVAVLLLRLSIRVPPLRLSFHSLHVSVGSRRVVECILCALANMHRLDLPPVWRLIKLEVCVPLSSDASALSMPSLRQMNCV